jgi:hypothetical protein
VKTADHATSPTAGKNGRAKGQGQWALGHHEPLNANEQFKKDDNPLNVRARIIDRYQFTGFDSIDPNDLRGRFRWMGIYTQRKPGIGGGQTAVLDPNELDDKYFMMRIRSDGGQLSGEQLRAIAEVSTTYGRDTADVTDRQNIQLHWASIGLVESPPPIQTSKPGPCSGCWTPTKDRSLISCATSMDGEPETADLNLRGRFAKSGSPT